MMKQKRKESKLVRCLKAPIRVLVKAKKYYMNMSQCAGGMGYAGGHMGCPSPLPPSRTFSTASSKRSTYDDDGFGELMRIVSARSLGSKVQLEYLRRQKESPVVGKGVHARSQSLGFGKIDEDEVCEFVGDVKVVNMSFSFS